MSTCEDDFPVPPISFCRSFVVRGACLRLAIFLHLDSFRSQAQGPPSTPCQHPQSGYIHHDCYIVVICCTLSCCNKQSTTAVLVLRYCCIVVMSSERPTGRGLDVVQRKGEKVIIESTTTQQQQWRRASAGYETEGTETAASVPPVAHTVS